MLHLSCAVGIHAEEEPRKVVRAVGVFPPRVHDLPIVKHRWAPFVILVKAQLADRSGFLIQEAQVGHRVIPAHARHTVEAARRGEDNPSVW